MTSSARAVVRLRVPVIALLALALLLAALAAAPTGLPRAGDVAATSPSPLWGVYTGPGTKNVAGASDFAASTGLPVTGVVDFPGETSWAEVRGPSWLLDPYRGSGLALEYSLPLLPAGVAADGVRWNLAACAKGAYDYQWTTLGKNLVAASQPATVIRPGWEFNGSWYRWSAAGKVSSFVTCFRRVVVAMRAVPGGRFLFDWNPNLGAGTFPAEQAYPGDGYVDVIGVDAYDTSWTWYPTPAGVTTDAARTSAWNWLLKGDHGLTFWSAFAHQHSKPMSITEWGVTSRPDGHGGADNPYFVDRMVDFITDPANQVVANHYFNLDTASVRHDLIRADTIFPASLARLRARAATIGAAAVPATTSKAPAAGLATTKARGKAKTRRHHKKRRRTAHSRRAARTAR